MSRTTTALRLLVATITLAVSATGAAAQGTANLPATDLAYTDIDRLSQLFFLDSTIIGQRPYSRREIGRILRAARERSDELGERTKSHRVTDLELAIADGILRRLETRFSREVDEDASTDFVFSPFDGVSLIGTGTDLPLRPFPASHTRPINARAGSLIRRRLGDPFEPGFTGVAELQQRVEPSRWLAFTARERFQAWQPRDTNEAVLSSQLLLGSVRARWRNVALSVGREEFAWAQTAGEGLFIAYDAPTLDQVSLTSDEPFALPGFLRKLGSTKATILLADLGASPIRSHSKLLAYKVSIAPSARSELGATFMNHFGGEGGRPSSLGNRLIDFLPVLDIFRRHNYTDSTKTLDVDSDKLLGIDGRLHVGGLKGVLFTGELLIDDFDVHRIPQLFTGYGSQTFAITVPRFISPLLSLNLQATHMGIITYSHGFLANGITSHGRLIGNELGPDAKAFYGRLAWEPTAVVRVTLEGSTAIYSNAEYTTLYTDANNTRFEVRKVSHTVNEMRDIFGGSMLVQTEGGPAITMRIVGMRARNYLFQGGDSKLFYAAELGFHLYQ
jgi:hypothetical protein